MFFPADFDLLLFVDEDYRPALLAERMITDHARSKGIFFGAAGTKAKPAQNEGQRG